MNPSKNSIVLIIMGVSGTGKSTVGKSLSKKLSWPYFEGDDFHPKANVEKMRQGIPLTDEDREPWLQTLRELIEKQLRQGHSAILASSALKNSYRNTLAQGDERIRFVYLQGSFELIMGRLQQRKHEYMPASLLKSQFDTLEEPLDAIKVSIDQEIEEMVEEVLGKIF